MMDEVKPDGVIIATPNGLHLGVACEAVRRGIVPLVEKPISDDLADAEAFAAEAEAAGVPVLVGQTVDTTPLSRGPSRSSSPASWVS